MKSIAHPASLAALLAALALGLPAISQDRAGGTRAQDAEDDDVSRARPAEGASRRTFGNVDTDNSNWISLREAEAALGFDAGRFRTFDGDRDGRIVITEFQAFLQRELVEGRRLPTVDVTSTIRRQPRRSALQLRLAFDEDVDGVLDRQEFETLARLYGYSAEHAERTFARADRNGDVGLDVSELEGVAEAVDPTRRRGPDRRGDVDAGGLFDSDGRRERSGDQAPQILGPVLPFMRLDLDNDGILSSLDIDRLRGRMQVPIALQSALNDMDFDGDGEVTKTEFLHSIDPTVSLEDESAKR